VGLASAVDLTLPTMTKIARCRQAMRAPYVTVFAVAATRWQLGDGGQWDR
jgi:hypothetical protein